jgi:hypothetical protein
MHAEEAKELQMKTAGAHQDKAPSSHPTQTSNLTDGNYVGVTQVSNIAELRKKKIGR